MEKMTWIRPMATVEQFMANEYIAACGDGGVVYKFTCNAGNRWSSYHVYLNGPDGIAHTGDDIDWSGRSGSVRTYSPCGEYHAAEDRNDFHDGYMYECDGRCDARYNPSQHGAMTRVVVWTANGTNTHTTDILDKNEWEVLKS